MKELFDWVPWFQELAAKVGEMGREGLVERAKRVNWGGYKPAVLEGGEEKADPLTFFYHLASIGSVGKEEKRRTVYSSVAQKFGIDSELDHRFKERFILPEGIRNVRFNKPGADPDLLWRIFDQARTHDGTGSGTVTANTFARVLEVEGVGIPKLTQTLFLINPKAFLPFDTKAVLPLAIGEHRKPPSNLSWAKYLEEANRIRAAFPGCECYEINIAGFLRTSGQLPRGGRRWYQINAGSGAQGDETWRDFRDNHWVHHDGAEGMDEPEPGDIVLVHSGNGEGRGIGVVYRNDYGERPNEDGRIHVLWVNKSEERLAGTMPTVHFSRIDHGAHEAFAKSPGYSKTFKALPDPPPPPPPPPPTPPPPNQILYGPPGTGKTWSTTTHAMAIVKGVAADAITDEHRDEFRRLRFDPEAGTGQIAMVTFHQNFSYEDFVEGIRPRLGEGGDIGYELRPGIFRRIAEAAEGHPNRPYVLIVDEINRGNIPKILGELITLVEESRRLGSDDETTVTLPYSGKEFGVPKNLYIIGTMNTADRSILLLDTALRRRFDFVEMMPNPDHRRISGNVAGIDLRRMLRAMNTRISLLLDRERQIGHTYLFGVSDLKALATKFQTAILPLLQEYFHDDWSKIRHVLGGAAFVVEKTDKFTSDLASQDLLDPDAKILDVLPADASEWRNPAEYMRIYGGTPAAGDDSSRDSEAATGDAPPSGDGDAATGDGESQS